MRSDDEIPGWLHRAIRDEAARHGPDRAYMHTRVLAAMPSRERRSRLRVIGASLATAATVAATTVAVWQGFAGPGPAPTKPVAGSAAPTFTAPRVPAAPSGPAGPMATAGSPVPVPRQTASVTAEPSGTGRFLRCAGTVDSASNPYWTQENVNLTTERPLGSLRVTVQVAGARGVESTNWFLTLPRDDFRVSVREWDGRLTYQFVLRKGRTVSRGRYVFAVQFRHDPGRRGGRLDTYHVTATAVDGPERRAGGHF